MHQYAVADALRIPTRRAEYLFELQTENPHVVPLILSLDTAVATFELVAAQQRLISCVAAIVQEYAFPADVLAEVKKTSFSPPSVSELAYLMKVKSEVQRRIQICEIQASTLRTCVPDEAPNWKHSAATKAAEMERYQQVMQELQDRWNVQPLHTFLHEHLQPVIDRAIRDYETVVLPHDKQALAEAVNADSFWHN